MFGFKKVAFVLLLPILVQSFILKSKFSWYCCFTLSSHSFEIIKEVTQSIV